MPSEPAHESKQHSHAPGMSSQEELPTQPLLQDLETGTTWGSPPHLDEVEGEVTEQCSVTELLTTHQAKVLRYLQEKGVSKLGEFEEDDTLVFPAFQEQQLLAIGADSRRIDYEAVWRRELRKVAGDKMRGWSNKVIVEAYVVNIRDAAAPDKRGLLQPLLKRYQARRCSYAVFALPAVHAVIKFKWHTFARRLLIVELAWFLVWLVSFNVFVIAFQDEDLSSSLRELLRERRGRVTVAAELLALVGMAPFLLLEVGTLPAYGFSGWLDQWNVLDVLTYFIQIGVTVMHLGRWYTKSEWLTTLLAVQIILLVFRLQWYTQAFSKIRFAYLPIIRDVWSDLRPYFYFMLIVMWGFACAFYIALRRDQEEQKHEYSSIITAFLSMFEHQYGDMEMKPMWSSKSPKIATSLAVAYTFIQGTVVINMILGVIINSLERVTEHQSIKLLLNQARIIDELESTMPSWIERRFPAWFPPFVHMLRIDPDRLDAVEQDELWTRMGRDEPQVLQEAPDHPLKEGHPSHVGNGNGGEEDKEEEEGGKGEGPGGNKGKSGGGGGSSSRGEKGGSGGGGDTAGVEREMAALRRQLEEQGELLQRVAAQLAPAAPTPAEQ